MEPSLTTDTAARPAVRLRWDDVRLAGTGVVLPEGVRTTASLEDAIRPLYQRLGLKPGWVEAVTGITERRVWGPSQGYLDGAVRAARTAMREAGVTARDVDVVVSCSVYKHRLEPSLASEIQGALGIGGHGVNYDVANACLGFLTGMVQVANMLQLGQVRTALVVASEDATPVLDATVVRLRATDADIHTFKDNLATLTLGSAATAAVLTAGGTGPRLVGGTIRSAAQHHDLCQGSADGMITDSVRLLREGVALAQATFASFQDIVGWSPADVHTAAMHQVGKAHHDAILSALGVGADRAPQVYPWLGNVGACGVPATAFLARDRRALAPGDRMALMGIGSGLNCAIFGVTW